MTIHDTAPGPLPGACESCYGANIQVVYGVVDVKGQPVSGKFTFTEHLDIVTASNPRDVRYRQQSKERPDRFVTDTIGARSNKPFGYLYLKTEQTFTVIYKGREYGLTTKINQYVTHGSSGWAISAVIVVP